MQNAQNAFGMSMQAQSFLWQELRDQADYDFKAYENDETRKVQLIATAMGNESEAASKWQNNTNVQNSISKILGT
jgi:transposase